MVRVRVSKGKGKGIVSREGTGYLVWFGRAQETRRVGAEEGEGREERRNEYRTRSDRMRMEGREDSLGRKKDAVRCGEVQASAGAGAGWADQRGCVCGVCPDVSSVVSLPLKQLEQQHEATSDFDSLALWLLGQQKDWRWRVEMGEMGSRRGEKALGRGHSLQLTGIRASYSSFPSAVCQDSKHCPAAKPTR